ncbi:MAG: T9SS type A sorting domain-containing protein [Candidatus Neomarinimicrobiota bacterium]
MRDFVSLRVEFQTDNYSGTTGNGRFMLTEWTGHDTVYSLDPLPHNRAYFSSHLKFLQHYWQTVSNGNIIINTDPSLQLPQGEQPYVLDRQMQYYSHPDSLDFRLATLIYESVSALKFSGDSIPPNDGIIIFHAGVGQDFNIPLDDSPFDIPSFYFDKDYLERHLSAEALAFLETNHALQGIVLPETQNQLKVNIALNGTAVLLSGMMLGLPPLYNTETGRSVAGIFGLMDQGSNNANGLCPIRPSAFERMLLGATSPQILESSGSFALLPGETYSIPVSSNEYFLLEFRKNTGIWADSLFWSDSTLQNYHDVLQSMNNSGLIDYTLENGVLTSLSDYDVSLPASGLLIWHVCEPDLIGSNPNADTPPLLDLLEADGGNDIGKVYNTLDPSVNNGWKWDMWFKNNPAWSDNNPNIYRMQLNDNTHPDSRSAAGLSSGIAIQRFDFYKDSVLIRLVTDPPAKYNFSGMVFDEMTPAAGSSSSTRNYIGYRDSSLYFFNDVDGAFSLFTNKRAYTKGSTALMSYGNDIIQVSNFPGSAIIKHLVFNPVFLTVNDTLRIDHPVDLEHLALWGDSLFLAPHPALPEPNPVLILDLSSGSLETRESLGERQIPYVHNGRLSYIPAPAAAVMNDNLIFADNERGFYLSSGVSGEARGPVAEEHAIRQLIPIHLNQDGLFELLALTTFDGRPTLSAFTQAGYLLNGFPVFNDYRELRAYYLDGEPKILAYNPAGKIDVFLNDATLDYSLAAPVNASSFFIEQIERDTAWIICDGSIYSVRSDSVYWGYNGKDPLHSNEHHALQKSSTPVFEHLIRDALIYNYPNPAEGEATRFRFFATGAQQVSIQIFQLSGRYVTTLNADDLYNNQWNEVLWDVSALQSGVYIAKIRISGEGRSETYLVKPAVLK